MRDLLIELIVNSDIWDSDECKLCTENDFTCVRCYAKKLADHLLVNGVIVPLCEVGDKMYVINRGGVPQEMVFDTVDLRCTCPNEDKCLLGSFCSDKEHNVCQYRFKNDLSDVGKTVFLTKEEAERALKGGEG